MAIQAIRVLAMLNTLTFLLLTRLALSSTGILKWTCSTFGFIAKYLKIQAGGSFRRVT